MLWYRSQLVRDASGNLACPDDARGLDIVSLSNGNAAEARGRRMLGSRDSADGTLDSKNTVPSPGFIDPNGPPYVAPNGGPTGALSVFTNLWLRADTVVVDSSGLVTRWPDQSSRNNDLFALSTAARPSVGVSPVTKRPYVMFDGVAQFLQATMALKSPMWVWLVMEQLSWTVGHAIFAAGNGLTQNSVTPNLRLSRNSPGTDNPGMPLGTWTRAICNYVVAGADYLRLGSSLIIDAGVGQRAGAAFTLGGGFNGTALSNIAVSEVLVAAGEPTPAEQAAIDAYGATRYTGAAFG